MVTSSTRFDLHAAQGLKKARMFNEPVGFIGRVERAACLLVASIRARPYGKCGVQGNLIIAMVPITSAYHAEFEPRSVALAD
jgi:hypothetical protein